MKIKWLPEFRIINSLYSLNLYKHKVFSEFFEINILFSVYEHKMISRINNYQCFKYSLYLYKHKMVFWILRNQYFMLCSVYGHKMVVRGANIQYLNIFMRTKCLNYQYWIRMTIHPLLWFLVQQRHSLIKTMFHKRFCYNWNINNRILVGFFHSAVWNVLSCSFRIFNLRAKLSL